MAPGHCRCAISGIVLDAPDAGSLAAFYRELLGWEVEHEDDGWVKLRSPHGGAGLSFQSDPELRAPDWPGRPGEQRMMAHLDIQVDGLDAEVARAVALGARLADDQPQDRTCASCSIRRGTRSACGIRPS